MDAAVQARRFGSAAGAFNSETAGQAFCFYWQQRLPRSPRIRLNRSSNSRKKDGKRTKRIISAKPPNSTVRAVKLRPESAQGWVGAGNDRI